MPAKRKAGGIKGGGRGKKARVEQEVEPMNVRGAIETLKTADKWRQGKKKIHKVDGYLPSGYNFQVYEDYDCMLNQTNIRKNNNKYYVIQLLRCDNGMYYTWNRWGRVGEAGAHALKGPLDVHDAVKDFEKKYHDKTLNRWQDRVAFKPVSGKYTLLEMAHQDVTEDEADAPDIKDRVKKNTAPSSLDPSTRNLVKMIFDNDMFNGTMRKFDIDVKKLPLGELSRVQIARGFDVLEEIQTEQKKKKPAASKLKELSSKFYTIIPHSFGRKIPPPISDSALLREKFEMLLVLGDIELAQSLQKSKKNVVNEDGTIPHPQDVSYDLLNCELELLDPKSREHKIITTYQEATMDDMIDMKIQHIWRVTRHGEDKRFSQHDAITNRKLLWHGTDVAVVAAILKNGLRIMPHSGGSVGQGIYFASECSLSAGFVWTAGESEVGVIFLSEVALGREHHIVEMDTTLVQAPDGFDSVVGRGLTEPDPGCDTFLKLDGKKVTVPQGRPIDQPEFKHSEFAQSEYLVYKESQCRIRYLLQVDMSC